MSAESNVRPNLAVRSQDGLAGFTLIEVLLALALFAISVVVLASSYVNVLVSLEAVRVDRVLEQEMAFVRSVILTSPDRDTIEEGGELPTAELGYAYWEAELEPTDLADLFIVHVSVTLEGTNSVDERTLNDRLIVLRPTWSEPLEREELRAAAKGRLAEMKLNRPL
jgi:prepilin-type N-terminal cleavage/methylation domain-containing protein